MLMVGVLIYVLMRWAGHYYVEGVGYAAIQATLTSQLNVAWFCCCSTFKMFATSVSLGSGSSGGIFSPSLFMGATLGGAFTGEGSVMFSISADQHARVRHGSAWARWSAVPPARR